MSMTINRKCNGCFEILFDGKSFGTVTHRSISHNARHPWTYRDNIYGERVGFESARAAITGLTELYRSLPS